MVPSSKTTENVIPDWYTNYAMDILSNQQAISNQPYTLYNAPRIASFAPEQQQAFGMTAQAAQSYQPALQAATQATQRVDPYLGLYAAQPYYQKAGQTSASQVGQYMNPYTEQVVNRIGTLGNRALQEQLLPGIRDKFIAGGTYGGSRNAEMFGRGVRDAMEGISAAQTQALNTGYNTSLSAAQEDLRRQASLGQDIASQYGTAGSQQLSQANQLGALASQGQTLGFKGAEALQGVGALQQAQAQKNLDLAYQDFLRQQQYPQTQNAALIAALQGVKSGVPTATLSSGIGPAEAGTMYGKSDLDNWLTAANSVGDFVSKLKSAGIF
jgi:hypothetical protein